MGIPVTIRGLGIAVVALMLAGCVPVTNFYGQGPIKLSENVRSGFAKYEARDDPRFFAVSADGNNFGYSFCRKDGSCRDWEVLVDIALIGCKKRSAGEPCYIYARGLRVVWGRQ
jgi:hypothetical protein